MLPSAHASDDEGRGAGRGLERPEASGESRARAVTDAILADLATAERGVVVDSPPGAGKSTLVVAAAASLAERGERVMVVGQTNEQVDDLIDRMATNHGVLRIGRLSAQDYTPAQRAPGTRTSPRGARSPTSLTIPW